jgi:hypothetical protein
MQQRSHNKPHYTYRKRYQHGYLEEGMKGKFRMNLETSVDSKDKKEN